MTQQFHTRLTNAVLSAHIAGQFVRSCSNLGAAVAFYQCAGCEVRIQVLEMPCGLAAVRKAEAAIVRYA